MFIVADQSTFRVCRKRRLACARKTEEQRGIALRSDVGRAVHGKHALLGKQVIHDGEHRLLEFTGVARATDQDHTLRNVEHNEGARARTMFRGIGLELRCVVDREVGRKSRELLHLRAYEHVAHEVRVPCIRQDVADTQPRRCIGAAIQILDEEFVQSIEVRLHVRLEQRKVRRIERLVDLAPIDVRVGRVIADDELVVGRAARVR